MSNHANPIGKFLRSSLVSRHRQIRGEPWKARASESKGSVQARAAGITTSGADRVGPTRLRPVTRAWKGASLVLKPMCLHTYELLKIMDTLGTWGDQVLQSNISLSGIEVSGWHEHFVDGQCR